MFQLPKFYVSDESQPPIAEFEQLEEILENYGLVQLMEAATTDNVWFSKAEALEYYQSLQH